MIKKLLPSLILLPLLVVPPNAGTSLYWLLGLLMAALSFLKIIILLFNRVIFIKKINKNIFLENSLVVLIVFSAIASVEFSKKRAENFAKFTAFLAQDICNKESECPASLSGYHDDYGYQVAFSGYLTEYKVVYYRLNEGKNFSLRVEYDIDCSFQVHGGVGLSQSYSEPC